MWTLFAATFVAAAVTIVLNAHHGYVSAGSPEYAVMMALLFAALDIAKCSLIAAGVRAWRNRYRIIACACFFLFPWLFANSVWNAVSQVSITRNNSTSTKIAGLQQRDRITATHKRLLSELATMQANPTFTATAACTLPKSKDARSFCDMVAATKSEIAGLESELGTSSPMDPAPQVTLLAAVTGYTVPSLTFGLAVVPVLLAELVGSLGFVLAAAGTSPKPLKTPKERLWRRMSLRWPSRSKNRPGGDLEASGAMSSSPPGPPTVVWPIQRTT